MANKNTLQLYAQLSVEVQNAAKAAKELEAYFGKLDLGDKVDKQISGGIEKATKAAAKYEQILAKAGSGSLDKATLGNITRYGEEATRAFAELEKILSNVENTSIQGIFQGLIESNKDIQDFNKNISELSEKSKTAAKTLQEELVKGLSQIEQAKTLDGENLFSTKSFKGFESDLKGLISTLKDTSDVEIIREDQANAAEKIKLRIRELEEAKAKLEKDKGQIKIIDESKVTKDLEKIKNDLKQIENLQEQLKSQKGLSNFEKTKGQSLESQIKGLKEIQTLYKNLASQYGLDFSDDFKQISTSLGVANNARNKEDTRAAATNTAAQQLLTIQTKITNQLKEQASAKKEVKNSLQKELNEAPKNQAKTAELQQEIELQKQRIALLQQLQTIINSLNTDQLEQLGKESKEAAEALEVLLKEQLEKATGNFKGVTQGAGEASDKINDVNNSAKEATVGLTAMQQEVSQLISRFTYFTSIAGIMQIVTKAIRSAYQSVKELDEAMNNIAVVTEMTTDDLWGQIDAYTQMANATGSTIKGVYEVAQLYYQQGLSTNEVMTMTTETLKMARIAGIDYAAATDYMTATIKGFGLAYEEVGHISDVYSNLAARTATDTEEIAIAMSKVASIAHSTGMEMETTAAMLAQILEVTREAPETAGTALKTVIARFGEVKTLIEKGETTGTDEEGEVIDVNKIDAALKTAGMSLLDQAGQMRDLDDVLLELSSRWSSLSDMQQRYIATQAAGSRQQSRFLALMNDYEGLMKMVGYANDSAGASQEQFDKTLESLASKLNNLHNAWTEFTTGIANSTAIKSAVDLLTNLLNVVNDLTGSFGDVGTAISRVALIGGGLKIGGNVLGGILSQNEALAGMSGVQALGGFGDIGSILRKVFYKTYDLGVKDTKTGKNITEELNSIVKGFNLAKTASGGATKSISAFWGALSAGAKASLVIAGITAAIWLLDKAIVTTKERAERFQETLNEIGETKTKISTLSDELSQLHNMQKGFEGTDIQGTDAATWEQLASGVSSYGDNISLTSEQYERYKSICEQLVNLNPSLMEGYSNELEAISANKEALEEYIEVKQEELRNDALKQSNEFDKQYYKDAIANYSTYREELIKAYNNKYVLDKQLIPDIGMSEEAFSSVGITNLTNEALKIDTAGVNRITAFSIQLEKEGKKISGTIPQLINNARELSEYQNEIIQQINNSQYLTSNEKDNMLSWIDETLAEYDQGLAEAEDKFKIASEKLTEASQVLHDSYLIYAQGRNEWKKLSEEEQKYIENWIRESGQFDITSNSTAESLEKNEKIIRDRIKNLEKLKSYDNVTKITLDGVEFDYNISEIFNELFEYDFGSEGYNAGLEYITKFFEALKQLAGENEELETLIGDILGVDNWKDLNVTEAFGNLYNFDTSKYTKAGAKIAATFTPGELSAYGLNETILTENLKLLDSKVFDSLDQLNLKEILEKYGTDIENGSITLADAITTSYNKMVASDPYAADRAENLEMAKENEGWQAAAIHTQNQIARGQGLPEGVDPSQSAYFDLPTVQSIDQVSNAMLELSNNAQQAAQNQDDLASAIGDNLSELKAIKSAGGNYSKELYKISEAAQEVFGELADAEFVDDHIEAFERLAEGDIEAGEEIADEIWELIKLQEEWTDDTSKEFNESFKIDTQEFSTAANYVDGIISWLDGQNLSIGASLDASSVFEGAQLTEERMKQLEEVLAIQGYSVVWNVGKGKPIGPNGEMVYDAHPVFTKVGPGVGMGGNRSGGGGGGGGGGGKKAEPQQDRFYNYIKNLEGVEREMEKLQDEMELLLDPEAIGENLDAQSDKFAELIGSNQSYLNALDSDMAKMQASMTSKFGKYITFAEDGTIRLTEAYYNASGDIVEEMDAWIEEYDDLIGRTDDLEGAIRDLKKEAADFFNDMRDSAIDLTDELADILKERDEKALEEKEKYYEELEKKDDEYLEAIRENIEAERKARDRANTYEDLGKKQSKLALLQRDTSGLYANEISSLQEEIDQTQQDLADEQIDGILDAIEKENADAAERHDEILKAMQEQIDNNVETRYYVQQAEQAIRQGYDAVEAILKSGQEYQQASDAKRDQLLEGLKSDFAEASWYFESGYRSAADYLANIMNSYLYDQTSRIVAAIADWGVPSSSPDSGPGPGGYDDGDDDDKTPSTVQKWGYVITGYLGNPHQSETFTPTSRFSSEADAEKALQKKYDNLIAQGYVITYANTKQYKTGGIVDYTGPAWVDGTKSRPEAFLNPEQTQIIRQLAENLVRPNSPFSPGITNSTTNNANCEINIEIGSIGNNVNIDEAIAKIKNEIIQSTQYRNVTVLTRKR